MIYLHIPFCASKCFYCDFHSVASSVDSARMVDAICVELSDRRNFLGNADPRTLYFGGGTPSILPVDLLTRLVEAVEDNFDTSSVVERTLEANPEHLSDQYLKSLRSLGFNRLSIGVQSFVDQHLSAMNRHHSSVDAQNAVRRAQRAGFDNISIDLIYGLPFMSNAQWEENISHAIDLGVQHISAYHLSIEERTVFHRRGLQPLDEECSQAQYRILCDRLSDADFEHYEISSFALPACRSRHNSGYWTGEAYLGAGPSAHSFDGVDKRSWNVASNRLYLEGTAPQFEVLTERDRHNEYLMTRLRIADGIDPVEYRSLFGCDFVSREGLILDSGRWRIAERDWLISDSIIASLFDLF